jgi:Peptidase family S41
MKIVWYRLTFFWGILVISFAGSTQLPVSHLPKIGAEQLKEDFQLLQKILEANHPSLYWYTPKDSIDYFFKTAINNINDSMDEVQFKNALSAVVSRIRCGHTSVRFSKAYTKNAVKYRYPQFPLSIKAWSDSLVVLNSFLPNDTIFKRGNIITSINGRSNRVILDTLFRFISSDGYADNYKNQVVSSNFSYWYKNVLGLDTVYQITYLDSTGKELVAQLTNFVPQKNSIKPSIPIKKISHREAKKAMLLSKRSLTIDTMLHTAFMTLGTFSENGIRRFIHRSFKKIAKENISNLVIDLRTNGGGSVNNSILLTKYLTDHHFKIGDSVVAIRRHLAFGRYIHPSFWVRLAMTFCTKKMADGFIHFKYYENKLFAPTKNYHFNGSVYLVQGGYSFSATTMFISQLKGQSNIKIIGEESGGGYYGNSAMHIPNIVLPNSGIQVSLPMYRLVMDKNRPKGHGIIPDTIINPSSFAIRKGIDLKIQKIKELLVSGHQ